MAAPSTGGDAPAASQPSGAALRGTLHKQLSSSRRSDALCQTMGDHSVRNPHHQQAAPSVPLRLMDAVHSMLGAITGWLLVRFAGLQVDSPILTE